MIRKLSMLISTTAFLVTSVHSVHAAQYERVELGGLNLTHWCRQNFGKGFKAKLTKKHATGWVCELHDHDRRPIRFDKVCKSQYGRKAVGAQPLNWSDPYSWKCYGRKVVPTMKGLNLTLWCRQTFGKGFKAKLTKRHATGWVCERGHAHDRRPIRFDKVCKFQYGRKAIGAKPLNWSDPYSWKCLLS